MPKPEYTVEGYNVRNPETDGELAQGMDFDPAIQFAYAGDPEKQAEWQSDLETLQAAALKAEPKAVEAKKDEPVQIKKPAAKK